VQGELGEPKLALRDSPLGGEKTPVRGLRPALRARKDFISSAKFFSFFRYVYEVDRRVTCKALHASFILKQNSGRSLAVMRKHIFERQ